jgi:CheY-like chemotaxis protein
MDVLFMDDDEGNRGSVVMRMRQKGHVVTAPEFFGGDEGFEEMVTAIGDKGFDAVILDLNWDGSYAKDGVKAAQHIHDAFADGEWRPTIMLWSANTESLSPDELKLFDRVLRKKGTPEAMKEMGDALAELAEQLNAQRPDGGPGQKPPGFDPK